MHATTFQRCARLASLLLAVLGGAAQAQPQDIELYDQPRFAGNRLRLPSDTPDVNAYGLGGRMGSVVVLRGRWEFCTAVNYGGACITVGPGRYAEMPPALRGNLASVRRADSFAAVAAPVPVPVPVQAPPSTGRPGEGPGYGQATGPGYGQGHGQGRGPGRWGPPVFMPDVNAQGQQAEAIVLFEHGNFDGRALGLSAAVAHLGQLNFNDTASSVLVQRGRWQLCEHADYGGECMVIGPGRHSLVGRFNDVVTSLRPVLGNDNLPMPPQGAIVLFDSADFTGRQLMRTEGVANLKAVDMNDMVSAIEVWGGQWELCTDANFSGQCVSIGPGRYRLDPTFSDRISSVRPR